MGAHSLQSLTPERRAWAYDVVKALMPILVALGAVASGQAQMALLLVAALLGFGTTAVAARNVSPGPRDGNPNPEAMR